MGRPREPAIPTGCSGRANITARTAHHGAFPIHEAGHFAMSHRSRWLSRFGRVRCAAPVVASPTPRVTGMTEGGSSHPPFVRRDHLGKRGGSAETPQYWSCRLGGRPGGGGDIGAALSPCMLVAGTAVWDLLFQAKLLFVAAMVAGHLRTPEPFGRLKLRSSAGRCVRRMSQGGHGKMGAIGDRTMIVVGALIWKKLRVVDGRLALMQNELALMQNGIKVTAPGRRPIFFSKGDLFVGFFLKP